MLPSQSLVPGAQVVQELVTQRGVGSAHVLEQLPQWKGSVEIGSRHPLFGLPAHTPKPDEQAGVHAPEVHAVVPFGFAQVVPHVPQFEVLVDVFASHPVEYCMSQSLKGGVQLACEYIDGLALKNRDVLARANGRVEVPVLDDHGHPVVGSSDIVGYLERVHPLVLDVGRAR